MFLHALTKNHSVEKELIVEDKKSARPFGGCAVGKKIIYLNSFYIDMFYYIPGENVDRVFKRIAMTKGGYQKGKMFASQGYLVVCYDGMEKQIIFKHEDDVDKMINYIKLKFPNIKIGKP